MPYSLRVRDDVVDHVVGLRVFHIQVGVRVVFGNPPDPDALIPESRPPWIALEEACDPQGVTVIRKPGRVLSP
jgi:hypothetical protein